VKCLLTRYQAEQAMGGGQYHTMGWQNPNFSFSLGNISCMAWLLALALKGIHALIHNTIRCIFLDA
jgi:hypothetical protein